MSAKIIKQRLVYGVGYKGNYPSRVGRNMVTSYSVWANMLKRCYIHNQQSKAYENCSVCQEWHYYEKFKRWFDENYIPGNQLDKDLLCMDCKVYSPETCCFLPPSLNQSISIGSGKPRKENLPKGVFMSSGKYTSKIDNRWIGSFDTPEEAHAAWKKTKLANALKVSKEALNSGRISAIVYEALILRAESNFS